MTEKLTPYLPVWNKYLPAIKILMKKSAAGEQLLAMNRSDFDKVVGLRKSGYRFIINLTGKQPDGIFNGNGFMQSFITILQTDETIRELFSINNYSFVFNSKYQLQIKNNRLFEQAAQPILEETLSH